MSNGPCSRPKSHESLPRQIVEFFACLTIAVALFKTFQAEGYLIWTGSMAPTLVGYHKQVTCPTCQFEFAQGVSNGRSPPHAICPNCCQPDIDVSTFPQDDGDQLLVHKLAFAFRDPQRWEVSVFRNPRTPTEAYVKRIVGLPGESLEIRDGNVYVGGKIQTKGLLTQRGVRILVYDHDFRPPTEDLKWRPRWVPDAAWTSRGGGFLLDAPAPNSAEAAQPLEWISYRHWIRAGGEHLTTVPLGALPAGIDLAEMGLIPLRYDAREGVLLCHGALPEDMHERLFERTEDAGFRAAISQLYEQSHCAPITDTYAYNRHGNGGTGGGETPVRDVMLAFQARYESGQGEFQVQLSDGNDVFTAVFDVGRNEIRLEALGTLTPLRIATLPEHLLDHPALVEFSLMDQQVLLAVNGKVVFTPWNYEFSGADSAAPRRPVRIGARGVRLQVDSLQLYRDVYYTAPPGSPFPQTFLLRNDERKEFFALGDNSPVSVDSRMWPAERSLTQDCLIGKPFMVHLPARNRMVRLGGWQGYLRIPDLSRIRYIH